MGFRIEPPPTWWQKRRRELSDWWLRGRVRLCCWMLGIDAFRIELAADPLTMWVSNIPMLQTTLNGSLKIGEEGNFTHSIGTLTFTYTGDDLEEID